MASMQREREETVPLPRQILEERALAAKKGDE